MTQNVAKVAGNQNIPAAKEEEKVGKHDKDEDQIPVMGLDEYYPDNHVEKRLNDSHISRRNVAFHGLMGFQSYKRYNLHFLEENIIIFTVGNKYQIYNMDSKEYQTFHGKDNDGIGSIGVHPTRRFFAVAEKGAQPLIYIYEYPSLRLYRLLKAGTEMMYVHCEFSTTGEKLVSLGGEPDYTITVWDWKAQRVILKSKAFSAEVFRASFSPYIDNIIFTSGSAHIKFWKMASTFTGLKLQGEIAKFGKLELSDVAAFYELPDGKVLSGTDQGTMILWDGVQVKAHLVLAVDGPNKKPLHNGAIEVILFENDEFITAGTDGFIKWWSLAQIDNAEADEVAEVIIQPIKEISIKTDEGVYAHIIEMKRGHDFWLIQDARGHLWRVGCSDFEAKILMNFHSGAITDMAVSDSVNMAVTVAQDGCIKLWDYVRKKPLYERKFNGRAECIDLLRRSDVNKGRVAAVGYDSGIARIVYLSDSGIELGVVFKAADAPIVRIKYAPSQNMLVTASKTGEIFFFEVNGHADLSLYMPLCMVQLPDKCNVTDLKWDNNSSKILISADNGKVYELQKPKPSDINNRETYLIENYAIRQWKMKMMEFQMKKNQKKDEVEEEKKRRMRLRGELTQEEHEEDEDWDPECITRISYLNDNSGRFLVGSQGKYSGYYYLCDFNSARPLEAFPMPKDTKISYIQFSNFGDLLLIGFENGDIRIQNMERPKNFLSVKQHDGHGAPVTAAKLSFDERFLVSSGVDGIIFVHLIDKFMIQQESKFDPKAQIEGVEFLPEDTAKQLIAEQIQLYQEENPANIPDVDVNIDGMDESLLAISLRMPHDVPDIIDESIYSIQQAKLRTEEDHRLKLAEEKKQNVRKKVAVLRSQFKALQDKNKAIQEVLRVSDYDFNIDPEYFESLGDRNQEKISETRKEVAWNIAYHKLKLDKLKNKFYDVLDFEKFTVKALQTQSYVTTFRVAKMSSFLEENIKQFKELLEKEMELKEQNDLDENPFINDLDDRGDAGKGKEKAKTTFHQGQKKPEQVFKTEADRKRAERKVEREARKAEIDLLTQKEHLNSGHDKEELAKIEKAKAEFGEFDLKMGKDYIVPESQQVNHLKKKQQMILLEGSIHKLKIDFNKKVYELKIRKVKIIEDVDDLYTRLSEINKELNQPEETVKYSIDSRVEDPDRLFDVKDEEIEAYREELKQRELDEKTTKKGGKKKKNAAELEKEKQEAEKKILEDKKKIEESKNSKGQVGASVTDIPDHERKLASRADLHAQENDLYNEIKMIRQIELQYEKEKIREEIKMKINDFDDEIGEMQKEKYRLESDLKNADIKLILLFEELIMLKSLENTDQELSHKLQEFKSEKGLIIRGITNITRQLQEKREKIDEIQQKENDIKRRFLELCPENNDKHDVLTAFFEKLTQRRKKPEKKKEDNIDDEEDDDADVGAEEEVEEEDEEDDDDQGIAGLNQEDYKIDDIENLRTERMDLFDEKSAIQEVISQLQKDQKEMDRKERLINSSLQETEEEIRDFQREKMQKLNQLEVAIVLKIKQIQNLLISEKSLNKWCDMKQQRLEEIEMKLHNGGMDEEDEQKLEDQKQNLIAMEDWRGFFLPKSLDESILFTRTQLFQLLNRKEELDTEIRTLAVDKTKNQKSYNTKKKERVEHAKELEIAERDYDERRMLRFGNLVDLDGLEVSGPSQLVIDLQNKFAKADARNYKLKEDAESDLQKTQRELTESIQNNTQLLNYIRALGEQLQQQQKKLDSTNKAIFVDEDNEEKKKLEMEREKYKQTLKKQAEDINKIKNEINLYKRKGGHIYTKVTTNRKVASLNDN